MSNHSEKVNRQCVLFHSSKDANKPAFAIRETPIPKVTDDDVLLKVLACGVCYSDCYAVTGAFGVTYPTSPGHEVVGKVIETGSSKVAQSFALGTMVGVGWHGGHCLMCESCADGDFVCCENHVITGIHRGGGYQEYMVISALALARVPPGMDPITAAPLMCAGVTVFNGLRRNNEKAHPPALVAVVGVGGLGHLAIQYAVKMGYTVVAISRGPDKKAQALELGATYFIDSKSQNVADALNALGGARIVLGTPPDAKAMGDCIDGLTRYGRLVLLGLSSDKIPVTPDQLIPKCKSVVGHIVGSGRDNQDTMEFAQRHGIVPKTIVFDGIDKAPEAYEAMRSGLYRVVIRVASE